MPTLNILKLIWIPSFFTRWVFSEKLGHFQTMGGSMKLANKSYLPKILLQSQTNGNYLTLVGFEFWWMAREYTYKAPLVFALMLK